MHCSAQSGFEHIGTDAPCVMYAAFILIGNGQRALTILLAFEIADDPVEYRSRKTAVDHEVTVALV